MTPSELAEAWPYLDQGVLIASRSRKVCLTCRWFRHVAPADAIPLLSCELHQGLLAHGEHLTRRCGAWSEEGHLLQGWAPEAA